MPQNRGSEVKPNPLPRLSRQSPKHLRANATALCLVRSLLEIDIDRVRIAGKGHAFYLTLAPNRNRQALFLAGSNPGPGNDAQCVCTDINMIA